MIVLEMFQIFLEGVKLGTIKTVSNTLIFSLPQIYLEFISVSLPGGENNPQKESLRGQNGRE